MFRLKEFIRKKLLSKLNKKALDSAYSVYYKLRYPNLMEKKRTYGNYNKDKIFYVIRPRTDGVEGLMSLFINVVKNMVYAVEHDYTAIVDFKNYKTQYQESNENVWELFFTQPSNVSLEEVYRSKNVILSGLEIQRYENPLIDKSYNNDNINRLHDFIFNRIDYKDAVYKTVGEEISKLGLDFGNTIGLYLRGTDYVALKPAGHPVQPTVEEAIEVVNDFKNRYGLKKIFLVTEDGTIYKKIKEQYGDECIIVSYDTFVNNYSGKDFLSQDKALKDLDESPYNRGIHYLVKLIILSKCSYFIGGDTMGSWASCIFSGKELIDKYIFDLGFYK